MKKKRVYIKYFALIIAVTSMSGCGISVDDISAESIEETATSQVEEVQSPNVEPETAISTTVDSSDDTSSDNSAELEDTTVNNAAYGPEERHYDRTYLVEENDTHTYELNDKDLVSQYNALYADAFQDMVDSYEEVMQWQNQKYSEQSATTSNLLYRESGGSNVINTGSYYEMDYNFDLNNVGYTYVDLDSDGTFELIFGILKYDDWTPDNIFERAYALVDGNVVKICEGGSRDYHWLGADGYIYETGSGGAAYSGTWRLHFDSTLLVVDENTDWGSNGFIEDEFLGYWEIPVHITDGPITDIDAAAKLPENAISEDDWTALNEEWESRQVEISWLKLSDYLEKYPLVGT